MATIFYKLKFFYNLKKRGIENKRINIFGKEK